MKRSSNELRQESLSRAVAGQSLANYPAIISGFIAKGIPEFEILPRENVFTFNAWKALGRSVKKGEHGVKVVTFIDTTKDGEESSRRPWHTTVFHLSQTEPGNGAQAPALISATAATAPENVVRITRESPANDAKLAARFRAWADALQPKIEHASRPMTQNPTPKRNREYQSRLHDARNMERLQRALVALAAAHEDGSIHAELVELRSKDDVARLVRKWIDGSKGGYYSVIEADDYAETTPRARLLQSMIDGSSAERTARERARKVGELQAEVALANIPGFFPTPAAVVSMMLDAADIEPGMRVLEPSAGSGNIADAVRAAHPSAALDVCEINSRLQQLLKLKGHNFVDSDFTEAQLGQYDRVLMNPPFEKGGDIKHIRRALRLLRPGGRLVAICAAGPRQLEALQPLGEWELLPEGAFKDAGTNVRTALLTVSVPGDEPEVSPDAIDAQEVNPAPLWALTPSAAIVRESRATAAPLPQLSLFGAL